MRTSAWKYYAKHLEQVGDTKCTYNTRYVYIICHIKKKYIYICITNRLIDNTFRDMKNRHIKFRYESLKNISAGICRVTPVSWLIAFDVLLRQAQQLESDLRRQRHNLAPMERSLEEKRVGMKKPSLGQVLETSLRCKPWVSTENTKFALQNAVFLLTCISCNRWCG